MLMAPASHAEGVARPARGDLLVAAAENPSRQALAPGDVGLEEAILAYALDPVSRTVKNHRNNLLIVVRLRPESIEPAFRHLAADGILAFSAICTHMGCIVDQFTDFGREQKQLNCRCHGSIFDPRRGAAVVDGPAPRPLPAIPIGVSGGLLAVAGGFTGRVGP